MFHITYKQKSIIAVSDTHGRHGELHIPPTDFLIHCGDACTDGNKSQLDNSFRWFALQPARHKLFIAGNHNLPFDLEPEEAINMIPPEIVYIENRKVIIEGIVFYSVAARPWLHELPDTKGEIDFLLTHGPAYSIVDLGVGCHKLLSYVRQTPPAYHLFGHIHELAQQDQKTKETTFFNVCIKNN